MPQLESSVVALLAGVFSALTQLVKGLLLTEEAKRWIPLGTVFLCAIVGTLLAFYYGRDPVAGVVEGVVAGLSALGLYATGKAVMPAAINTNGWIRRK